VVDEELAVKVVDGRDNAVVTLAGPLALRTIPQLNGALGQALVDRGCVLVDVAGLRLEWEPGVAVFATVLEYAGGWPGARMVLFGADLELAAALQRSQITQAVPLAVDLQAASRRVDQRPARVCRHWDLPAEPTAPGAARALVRRACVDWEIPIETENAAALVVSELAFNAVVHAGTSIRVIVELTDEALSVRVRDLRPDLPPRAGPRSPNLAASPDRTRSLGLRVVSALARSWGVAEQPDAKTVWAQLPLEAATTAVEAEPLMQHPPPPDRPDH
jgi:anti-sigma regulatory factor (Ser/Thr protein kinase)